MICQHDRELLNRAVGGILHLEDKDLTYYTGNYDTFANNAPRNARFAAAAKKQDRNARTCSPSSTGSRPRHPRQSRPNRASKCSKRWKPIRAPEDAARTVFTFPTQRNSRHRSSHSKTCSTGYGETVILRDLNLRIDQDDRIALWGATAKEIDLSKLLSALEVDDRQDEYRRTSCGSAFSHSTKSKNCTSTKRRSSTLFALTPREGQPRKLRARLAGFGLGADQADTEVGRLSGGQKARLSLLLATLPRAAPA